jgi:hypothetical protein
MAASAMVARAVLVRLVIKKVAAGRQRQGGDGEVRGSEGIDGEAESGGSEGGGCEGGVGQDGGGERGSGEVGGGGNTVGWLCWAVDCEDGGGEASGSECGGGECCRRCGGRHRWRLRGATTTMSAPCRVAPRRHHASPFRPNSRRQPASPSLFLSCRCLIRKRDRQKNKNKFKTQKSLVLRHFQYARLLLTPVGMAPACRRPERTSEHAGL